MQAATVAGTGDVPLVAGNDITIETAENTLAESHSSHTRKSGLFGTGGVGFTIGTQTRENTAEITELPHTGSLIGSTEGRVDIVAGGDVAIAGSDVLSKAGIGITGENVAITAVENSQSVVEAQKFRQAGLNVSLKGSVVDTAMAIYSAAKRSDEVEDDRLQALYAAKAGQTLFSDGQAFANTGQQAGALANTNKETEASGNSGLSLRIGIGASKSDSKQTYTATTAGGSRIASEGDVAIVARSGDVTVTGSQIEGDNVAPCSRTRPDPAKHAGEQRAGSAQPVQQRRDRHHHRHRSGHRRVCQRVHGQGRGQRRRYHPCRDHGAGRRYPDPDQRP